MMYNNPDNNIESAVLNNGITADYINLKGAEARVSPFCISFYHHDQSPS